MSLKIKHHTPHALPKKPKEPNYGISLCMKGIALKKKQRVGFDPKKSWPLQNRTSQLLVLLSCTQEELAKTCWSQIISRKNCLNSSWPCHRVRLHPGYSATGHPPKRQHPVVCKARPWWVLHSQHGLTIQCRNCRRGPSICMRFSLGNGNTKGCYPLFPNLQKASPDTEAEAKCRPLIKAGKPEVKAMGTPSNMALREGQQGRFKFHQI